MITRARAANGIPSCLRTSAAQRKLVGTERVADYDRYLNAAADAFTKRHLGLVRIAFERV
jgi:cyclopropane-fatty-acyl-phospholipid synthase